MRLGIIGTGRIADRFVKTALTGLAGVNITCVYNPRIESADRFAREHSIDVFTCELEEMASLVEAVYIASPHETHYEYAKAMLQAGKDVLCEKPAGLSKSQTQELYNLAKACGLVFMEAVKTAYCPGFKALVDIVKSGRIGRVVDVEAAFTRLTPVNTREYQASIYNGSMLEFGSYVLLPAIRLLGTDYREVKFKSIRAVNGVDAYTKVMLDYDNAMAAGKTGLGAKSEGQLLISGTNGYILAQSPWWMTKKFEVRYEDSNKREVYEFPYESSGLQYELIVFVSEILKRSGMGVGSMGFGVTEAESVVIADIMEKFMEWNKPQLEQAQSEFEESAGQLPAPKVWAHRGCSFAYPENTLEAFEAAAKIKGITGIELDVQLTSDGEIVVFHDENVTRVTDGDGAVKDYTLKELKNLQVAPGSDKSTTIPTLSEVLALLKPYCEKDGLLINIELKTSKVRYEGIEEKAVDMVKNYGMEGYIVWSSFLADSVALIKKLDGNAKTAVLAGSLEECITMAKNTGADALHPYVGGLVHKLPMDMSHIPVRAWNSDEPFFMETRPFKENALDKYKAYGATDIITNVPERYLG